MQNPGKLRNKMQKKLDVFVLIFTKDILNHLIVTFLCVNFVLLIY